MCGWFHHKSGQWQIWLFQIHLLLQKCLWQLWHLFSCPFKKKVCLIFEFQFWTAKTKFRPCPSTGPKIVCDGPNVMCQNKIYLDIEPFPNFLCQTKKWFAFSKFIFSGRANFFGVALNAIQFLVWPKKFGLA